MNTISNKLGELKEFSSLCNNINNNGSPIYLTGVSDSQKAHLIFSAYEKTNQKCLYICPTEAESKKAYMDFCQITDEENVIFFPSKSIPLYNIEARNRESIYERASAIEKILNTNYSVIVTSIEAILHKMSSPSLFQDNIINISLEDRIDISKLTSKLIDMGYTRFDIVESKGEFAVRGGILDIFPVNYENAIRIELWDDEIETIKFFDVDSQRSTEKISDLKITAFTDLIIDTSSIKEIDNESVREKFEQLKYFPGYEKYMSFFMKEEFSIFDYIDSSSSFVVFDNFSRSKEYTESLYIRHSETAMNLIEKGQLLPECSNIYFSFEDVCSWGIKEKSILSSTFFESNHYTSNIVDIAGKDLSYYAKSIELLAVDIAEKRKSGYSVTIMVQSKTTAKSLNELLSQRNIPCTISEKNGLMLDDKHIVIQMGSLQKGFEYPSLKISVITQNDIGFKKDKKKTKSSKDKSAIINTFTELSVGDFVVHHNHGVGKYIGIHQLVVEGIRKDYLKIMFKDESYIYIPPNQLDLIQKYIGAEGKTPRLNSLKGSDWDKAKKRVKESLRELAFELVTLYAKRQEIQGFAFHKDTVWQQEMEEDFIYEETPDQLKCIEEIKQDMELKRPMDRLLCGDVGYGKTEVAIRAIFKAVMSGKQVAFLAPTTILAQQQYETIKERFAKYPISVDLISRFRTTGEISKIKKDVKNGLIDVLVGTHRLIQKDIQFKDLGFIVIDEEQRFGVEHKELIKNMNPDIDVLTLTATPIPRTLHMSLVGIRDISILEDPPKNRFPVNTYVMEYDQNMVRDAMFEELSRGGQVFYLSNKVQGIESKTSKIRKLLPDANVTFAHGRMRENLLEDTIQYFIDKKIDVLVCTTIIESGIDMPNANTLIIEDADRMGLAQLYQIRGRIGRSDRVAYAYITYKKDKALSEIAEKRLKTIKEYTEFGSGFKIAMRDLEIRGAGNLIGANQHGHMDAVGYDMYCKLLDQAVKEINSDGKPIPLETNFECNVEINIDAYIDNKYIPDEKQKIDIYRKISYIESKNDIIDLTDEMKDRYGDVPETVVNLMNISYVRNMGIHSGFASIQRRTNNILLFFRKDFVPKTNVLSLLLNKYNDKISFNAGTNAHIVFKDLEFNNLISMLEEIMEAGGNTNE